jgi:gephyrin
VAIRVAILTVSDTAARDHSLDASGPALEQLLQEYHRSRAGGGPAEPVYQVVKRGIVSDDAEQLEQILSAWLNDEALDLGLVLTSGGTGFGARDTTPEVSPTALRKPTCYMRLTLLVIRGPGCVKTVSRLIHKPAPGLVALMLTSSLAITPMAALSRPVAGVHLPRRQQGLDDDLAFGRVIVTLPGSPKGAKENLSSLLSVLPHAVELARGAAGAGEKTHREMGLPERVASGAAGTPGSNTAATSVSRAHGCGRDHHSHGHGHGHSHAHGQRGHVAPVPRTMLSQDPSQAGEYRVASLPHLRGNVGTWFLLCDHGGCAVRPHSRLTSAAVALSFGFTA